MLDLAVLDRLSERQKQDRSRGQAVRYAFTPYVDKHNFVSGYIDYASMCSDAPFEYHEALAFILLACATPKVRAELSIYPEGLGTNLYVVLIGDSTRSRKSTSTALALHVLQRALSDALLPDSASPESLVEQLAERSGRSTVFVADEFAGLLDKLHHQKHMAGFVALLLTIYSGRDYRYSRHSKRTKDGERVSDQDVVHEPHLSIAAAATPSIFSTTTQTDIETGLLPRFAVVMPETLPPRKPFYQAKPPDQSYTNALVKVLADLHVWAQKRPKVVFGPGALETVDGFQAEIEAMAGEDNAPTIMLQRLGAMALKLSMLVACGRLNATESSTLTVTEDDARQAVGVARRWKEYAIRFAERVGETQFETVVQRVKRLLTPGKSVERRTIARKLHLSKRTLDEVQETLVDRGLIAVQYVDSPSGPSTAIWAPP